MTSSSTEAPVMPCTGCGAPLPVDPEAATVRCTACALETAVPGEVRERARAYREEIAAPHAAEARAREAAADYAADTARTTRTVIWTVVFATLCVAWVFALATGAASEVGLWGDLAFFTLTLLTVRGMLHGLIIEVSGYDDTPPPKLAVSSRSAACASCGGQIDFREGESAAACPFCGATAIATAGVEGALVAAAEGRAAGAGLVRDQALAGYTANLRLLERMPWFVFILLVIVALVLGTYALIKLDEAYPAPHLDVRGIAILLAATTAIGIVWAIKGNRRRPRP